MSYIIPSTSPFVSIKLTSIGRQNLATGSLNFSFWGIGDSELNYGRESVVDTNVNSISLSATSKILRPFDNQPSIKSYITPSNSSTPFQILDGSNVSVIKAIVNNKATERGFFSNSSSVFTTQTGSTYTPYVTTIPNTNLTGGTTLNMLSTSGLSVGDIILIKLNNNIVSGVTISNNNPIPYLWFKIQSKTLTSISVDRILPNYSNQTTSNSFLIVYQGSEVYETIGAINTTAYWDSGTLSFNASNNITCSDVPVWNMNSVWCENIAGITGLTSPSPIYEDYRKFGSYSYLGTKTPYLEYLCESSDTNGVSACDSPGVSYQDTVNKSIAIIHYTNNTISNLYGEFLFIDTTNNKTLRIDLPDLMYHRRGFSTASGTSLGMSFVASGTTQYIGNSDIEYIDLIEDITLINVNSTPLVVGRVFPQLKTIVIHNDEIVSALSYKSNRNWTLPALSAVIQSPSGGTSTGVLQPNETIYLTYILENTGTGLTTSLSCQDYVKLTNNTSSAKDIAFKISETDLLPYMRKKENILYDGLGFYAKKFKLVYQIVSDTNIRPLSGSWKEYDFTSTAITTVLGETIDPKLLENQTPTVNGFILDKLKDTSSGLFSIVVSLGIAPNVSPDTLQFGDEKFFYGNLSTYIGATIYKTIFNLNINANQFNTTTNPTRTTSTTTPLKISEVGIYDTNKNLVCIGKLSTPIPLKAGNIISLELSMDF